MEIRLQYGIKKNGHWLSEPEMEIYGEYGKAMRRYVKLSRDAKYATGILREEIHDNSIICICIPLFYENRNLDLERQWQFFWHANRLVNNTSCRCERKAIDIFSRLLPERERIAIA